MIEIRHPLYAWLICNSSGTIFSEKSNRILCNKPNHYGYVSVTFYKIGSKQAHRIIAEAFLGPLPIGKEVNHINGVKNDNRPCNLEYMTRSENMKHVFRNNLGSNKGEQNPRAILKQKDIEDIKNRRASRESYVSISKTYKVTPETISCASRGTTWKE